MGSGMPSCTRFVGLQQRLDEGPVPVLHERGLVTDRLIFDADFGQLFNDCGIGNRGGIADIADHLYFALAVFDDVGGERKFSRLVLKVGQMAAVVEEAVDDILDLIALALKKSENGKNGIFTQFRRGAVRGFSVSNDLFVADLS